MTLEYLYKENSQTVGSNLVPLLYLIMLECLRFSIATVVAVLDNNVLGIKDFRKPKTRSFLLRGMLIFEGFGKSCRVIQFSDPV